MPQTIGEAISEIRGIYKLVDQDSNLTDRYIYSLIKTPANLLMRRQDAVNKILKFNGIFQPLEFVELIEVDRVAAGCLGAASGCTFRRTKQQLPVSLQGYFGPLLRTVTSLDQSQECQPIYPISWAKMTHQSTFKYNKQKYYWYSNGYLYFPNVEWEAVTLEGVFEFGTAGFSCDGEPDCRARQDCPLAIPDFLFTEIKAQIQRDLGVSMQIPGDPGQDNKHPLN